MKLLKSIGPIFTIGTHTSGLPPTGLGGTDHNPLGTVHSASFQSIYLNGHLSNPQIATNEPINCY